MQSFRRVATCFQSVMYDEENGECSPSSCMKKAHFALSPVCVCRDLPEIIEYIKVKADIGDLEKKLTDWGRKIEIAEMDQARTKKICLAMSALPGAVT